MKKSTQEILLVVCVLLWLVMRAYPLRNKMECGFDINQFGECLPDIITLAVPGLLLFMWGYKISQQNSTKKESTETTEKYKYAGFRIRLLSFIIDCGLMAIAIYLFRLIMGEGYLELDPWRANLINCLTALFYYSTQQSSKHQATIGQRICKLKLISEKGSGVSFWQALGRCILGILLNLLFYIGFLAIPFMKKKQSLYDKIMKTYIIKI